MSLWPYRQVPPGCAQVADSGPCQKLMLGTATAALSRRRLPERPAGATNRVRDCSNDAFQLGELGVIEARAFWLRQQKR